MAPSLRLAERLRSVSQFLDVRNQPRIEFVRRYCETLEKENNEKTRKFRVLEIKPKKGTIIKKREYNFSLKPPRVARMPVDQDWVSEWPGPKTFHPASVPLPIRQGYNKAGPPPEKTANTELMKIPNFLHLTPPAIKRHCEAIKKFCTPWPAKLKSDSFINSNFPIEIITSDYCHSSPSIREPLANVVTLRVKLQKLKLDPRAKDKFLRLVGKRYDHSTDYVTITTDSCPIKKQNYNYAYYLLTALYFESLKHEEWENLMQPHEMKDYVFHKRKSFSNVKELFEYNKSELPDLKEFAMAVEKCHNANNKKLFIERYKNASLKLLSLPHRQMQKVVENS